MTQHASSELTMTVQRPYSVIFLHHFDSAACQEVPNVHYGRRPSVLEGWSASLLQQHHRPVIKLSTPGTKSGSRVKVRQLDLIFLDGRPDTEDTRLFDALQTRERSKSETTMAVLVRPCKFGCVDHAPVFGHGQALSLGTILSSPR